MAILIAVELAQNPAPPLRGVHPCSIRRKQKSRESSNGGSHAARHHHVFDRIGNSASGGNGIFRAIWSIARLRECPLLAQRQNRQSPDLISNALIVITGQRRRRRSIFDNRVRIVSIVSPEPAAISLAREFRFRDHRHPLITLHSQKMSVRTGAFFTATRCAAIAGI